MTSPYYDYDSDSYFRPDALDQEMRQVFDVCLSCRQCDNLCPSFDRLLGNSAAASLNTTKIAKVTVAAALDVDAMWDVVDLCTNCKLCLPHCPYSSPQSSPYNQQHHLHGPESTASVMASDRNGTGNGQKRHNGGSGANKANGGTNSNAVLVDFPALMLRAKAVEAMQKGGSLQAQVLGNSAIIDRVGGAVAWGVNELAHSQWGKAALHKVAGLHRDFPLPKLSSTSLDQWFVEANKSRQKHMTGKKGVAKVALFISCAGSHKEVQTGKAIIEVLWHNRMEVILPKRASCGMAALDSGDVESARKLARQNIESYYLWAERGYDIVIASPSCSYMFKEEYPSLVGSDQATVVSGKAYDLCAYLLRLHAMGKLQTDFVRGAGEIAYYRPAHLTVQSIGQKSFELLSLLPDSHVTLIDGCATISGTWGAKTNNHDLAMAYGKSTFLALSQVKADVYASDCPMSRRYIAHGLEQQGEHRLKVDHPLELLHQAYGLA